MSDVYTMEDDTREEFLGIGLQDETVHKVKEDGTIQDRWHFAVRPVDYSIGKTGAWHMFCPMSKGKSSVMQKVLTTFKNIIGTKRDDGQVYRIGEGDLVGVVAWFERKDLVFERKGQDPFTFEGVLCMTRAATVEEKTRAANLAPIPEGGNTSSSAVVEHRDALSLSEVLPLADLIVNNTKISGAVTAALSQGLADSLIAELSSGQAVKTLVNGGIIEADKTGRYHLVSDRVGA